MSKPTNKSWQDSLQSLLSTMPEEEFTPEAAAPAVDSAAEKLPPRGRLNIAVERKGRGGKTATILYGFAESTSPEQVRELATQLKRVLGIGGSYRDSEILLQGDCAGRLVEALKKLGYHTNYR